MLVKHRFKTRLRIKAFVEQKVPVSDHFERRLHVLFLTAREQQREKDIKHVIACGK